MKIKKIKNTVGQKIMSCIDWKNTPPPEHELSNWLDKIFAFHQEVNSGNLDNFVLDVSKRFYFSKDAEIKTKAATIIFDEIKKIK